MTIYSSWLTKIGSGSSCCWGFALPASSSAAAAAAAAGEMCGRFPKASRNACTVDCCEGLAQPEGAAAPLLGEGTARPLPGEGTAASLTGEGDPRALLPGEASMPLLALPPETVVPPRAQLVLPPLAPAGAQGATARGPVTQGATAWSGSSMGTSPTLCAAAAAAVAALLLPPLAAAAAARALAEVSDGTGGRLGVQSAEKREPKTLRGG